MKLLLIQSDQHRDDGIRANGLRDIETPRLDRLCAEGVSFSRAYSTLPFCTRARASLMTGPWPPPHGSTGNPSPVLDRAACPEPPTIYEKLKARNYRTGDE